MCSLNYLTKTVANITCGNLIAYDKSFNLNINPHKLHDKTEFRKLNIDNQTMNDFVKIKEKQTTKQSKQIQLNNILSSLF